MWRLAEFQLVFQCEQFPRMAYATNENLLREIDQNMQLFLKLLQKKGNQRFTVGLSKKAEFGKKKSERSPSWMSLTETIQIDETCRENIGLLDPWDLFRKSKID